MGVAPGRPGLGAAGTMLALGDQGPDLFGVERLFNSPYAARLGPLLDELAVVGQVLPFRVSRHVLDELIDWDAVPDDPIYQLTFLHRAMLDGATYDRLAASPPGPARDQLVDQVRRAMNPNPAGQTSDNRAVLDGVEVPGIQHKYRDIALLFPARGQTCFSYCSFCFRWPQFVRPATWKMATNASGSWADYLAADDGIHEVLITGGDPLTMRTAVLATYVDVIAALPHVRRIRIGTKALGFAPGRFFGPDGDALLRLMATTVRAGTEVAVMAHVNHPRELEASRTRDAVRRIRDTGALVYGQTPMLRHVNLDPACLAHLWELEVELGITPYYAFVPRDTGTVEYFTCPLADAVDVFTAARARCTGLARTVRGPVMSCWPGKVSVSRVRSAGEVEQFALEFLRARDPSWDQRTFLATFDPAASWYRDLVAPDGYPALPPADGERPVG